MTTEDVLAAELEAWQKLRPRSAAANRDGTVTERLHRAQPAALCLSGGGIRSATFGLGVLQGLARKGLLGEFDYISTVSGGGYIGSWLTSWLARRARAGDDSQKATSEVFEKLAEGDEAHPYTRACEQEEIAHLRSYSNYLTPRLGLLSADTWTLAATYLRNVIVNWFVLLPFLLAVLALPRIWMSLLEHANHVTDAAIQVAEMRTMLVIAGLTGLILVTYLALVRPVPGRGDDDKKGKGRYGLWFAILGPGMLVIQALAMCYVRAGGDQGSGSSSVWWKATWDMVKKLPLGTTAANAVDAISKKPGMDDMALLVSLMLSVVLLNHIGWAIYTVRVTRAAKGQPVLTRVFVEFFGALIAGAAAGWFLWLIILKMFAEPMRQVARLPLSTRDLQIESFVCLAPAFYLLAFFVQTMMFVGITGKFNDDEDREWWARWAGWLLIVSVSSAVIGCIAVFGPLLIAKVPKTIAALGGISGIITLTLGRSGASPATQAQTAEKGWKSILTNLALAAAAPVFVVVIFSALSYVNTWLLQTALHVPAIAPAEASALNVPHALEPLAVRHFAVLRRTPLPMILVYTIALAAISLIASIFVQINRFSMHGLYRNRLTRAYLGASNTNRHENPFTGFDDRDNMPVANLPLRPIHVVNVALNLVSTGNLAWQERKAASFTISPLHCGSSLLGYRFSSTYASAPDGEGITLGTAVAISGAAVSPNMGYHTSPALSFLLTLFNVRLGWWLGNPGRRHYEASGPYSSLIAILAEAFGKTNRDSKWVYLSDGGHFENLGLYEMVRRRCHTIVVSDAGRDPKITFEDLGNAIRKIRIDLGIPITIGDAKIFPRDESKPGRYYAIGTIHYDVVDEGAPPGVIVYLKPSIYGKEPIDIRNYASRNVEFPHESTSDQWFTESQFESYRALGAFVVDDICGMIPVESLKHFVERLQSQRDEPPPEPRFEIRKTGPAGPAPPSPSAASPVVG